MIKYRFIYAIGVILLMISIPIGWAVWSQHYLIITDTNTGERILTKVAVPGDNVWVAYINSVENLPVGDQFVVDDRYGLVFSETIYMAPFAGYIQEERSKSIAPGVTRIPGINKSIDKYTFCAGYKYKHILFLNGTLIPLYDVAQGGDFIEIRMEKRINLKKLFRDG
ncbi:MAG: hypothetical protein JRD69_02910 [Deltaproteobacteria bacterium]|nr:hypothetical protein [Deltaproteobacteria bacterium]